MSKSKAEKAAPGAPEQPSFDARSFLDHCSSRAGVYQMLDAQGKHLYIGKAKNLRNRLSSYFRNDLENPKTQALVSKIQQIDVTVTSTETEALILERNLINAHRPPYNVIFRDDKSYPYIHLSEHKHPRLSFYRGSKKPAGRYYGPFPNSQAVRDTLNLLQKMFRVRQCEDAFFKNRSRPCLQHQIGRCSAPCVDLVDEGSYAEAVHQSQLFLEGKSDALGEELQMSMQSASDHQDYEKAAVIRDQIIQLRRIQEKQYIEGRRGDLDIIAAAIQAGIACVQVLFVRQGKILGSRSYYPKAGIADTTQAILEAFISQHYLNKGENSFSFPSEILCNVALESTNEFTQAFKSIAGRSISISHTARSARARWITMASETAQQNLTAKINSRQNILQRFEALQTALELAELPSRIECFDISHSSGEATVASCVVFSSEGARKSDYRRFNIENVQPGDDYAAMRQAISRRYTRLKKGEAALPDILLIDGGKGQVNLAAEVLEELQVDQVLVLGIAKGPTRKPGLESLFTTDRDYSATVAKHPAALQLVQQIRDEAHRFAISGHRARRDKKRKTSPLEEITGIGPKRRSNLLKHFGGWQEVERATVDELARAPGISRKIAEDIYAALH